MDAGAGVEHGLQEISLTNNFGRSLTSQDAIRNGGVGATRIGVLPDDPTGDFGSVDLLGKYPSSTVELAANARLSHPFTLSYHFFIHALIERPCPADQSCEYCWPITQLTYVQVRANLSFISKPNARSLLVAFLKSLFDPDYNTVCSEKYDFTLPTGNALSVAKKGIEVLEANLGSDPVPWTFEKEAIALMGSGDFVISSNRRDFPASERSFNYDEIAQLLSIVKDLEEKLANATAMLEDPTFRSNEGAVEFTEAEETKIDVALILAAVALGLVLCLSIFVVLTMSRQSKADAEEEAPTTRR